MCGLFGWNLEKHVPKRNKKQLNRLATALMLQNVFRGDDSWGFYSPNVDRRTVGLGDMSLMSNRSRGRLLDSEILIAHTRKATTGDVSLDNCHPFRIGTLVGAHNGMVFNHSRLNHTYKRQCNVDSEHIFYHLAEGRELCDITAYGAIVYHDKSSPFPIELAVFNNGELGIAHIKDVGVVWSSDKTHLKRALALSGWKYDKIEEPYEDLIYSVESTGIDIHTEIKVDEPYYETEFTRWRSYQSTGSCFSLNKVKDMKDDDDEPAQKALTAYPDDSTWPYAIGD